MKAIKYLTLLLLFVLGSCASVRIDTDYDKNANFSQFKTYAFYKDGIDKVEISDLDKKRILHAIDLQLTAKGMTKSENPDLLINIFTKAREQVNVNQFSAGWGYGWGYGWSPWIGGNYSTAISSSTEGTLYIDLIDGKKKELVWQGIGTGILSQNMSKKEAKINEFVARILSQYPPGSDKK